MTQIASQVGEAKLAQALGQQPVALGSPGQATCLQCSAAHPPELE
ncbi:MAG TPA: hypothetical protein VGL88_05020 [Pseudonocardiaceae bacterium]